MRLSDKQIRSIITKARQTNRLLIDQDLKRLKEENYKIVEEKVLEFSKKLEKAKDIFNICKSFSYSYDKEKYDLKQLIKNYRESLYKNIKSNIEYLDGDSLYNEIVLSSIDCKDLEDLCKKLKIKLTNN